MCGRGYWGVSPHLFFPLLPGCHEVNGSLLWHALTMMYRKWTWADASTTQSQNKPFLFFNLIVKSILSQHQKPNTPAPLCGYRPNRSLLFVCFFDLSAGNLGRKGIKQAAIPPTFPSATVFPQIKIIHQDAAHVLPRPQFPTHVELMTLWTRVCGGKAQLQHPWPWRWE